MENETNITETETTTVETEEATPETVVETEEATPETEEAEAKAEAEAEAEATVETRLQKIEKKLKAIASAVAMCRRTGVDVTSLLKEKERLTRERQALEALSALKRIEDDLRVIKNAGFAGIKLSEDAPTLVQTWPTTPTAPVAPSAPKAKRASSKRASRDWKRFEEWLASSGASLILRDRVVALNGGLIDGLSPGQAVMREYNWPSANAWATLRVTMPTGETMLAGAAYDRYVEG